MTSRTWRGVWVSDRPLSVLDGAYGDGDVVLQLSIPAEMFEQYEWVEGADKVYRESLIPAAVLNACGRPSVTKRRDVAY